MAFFKKSGNGMGLFPDSSISDERSLFTNDDERGVDCPCSIADGVIIPAQEPSLCPIPDVFISSVNPDDFN